MKGHCGKELIPEICCWGRFNCKKCGLGKDTAVPFQSRSICVALTLYWDVLLLVTDVYCTLTCRCLQSRYEISHSSPTLNLSCSFSPCVHDCNLVALVELFFADTVQSCYEQPSICLVHGTRSGDGQSCSLMPSQISMATMCKRIVYALFLHCYKETALVINSK